LGHGGEQTIVEDASGVDDGGEGMLGRDRVQERAERRKVRDVASGDGDASAGVFELASKSVSAGSLVPLTRDQEQMLDGVGLDEMSSELGAEGTGAAGDEDGAVGVESRCG
jgi:hypothetical protein